jgi:hypothetical protein
MTYKFAWEKRDYAKIDKLNALTNLETFWDDVRKLTRNVTSDHSIHSWQCLAEQRYAEILTDCEDVRREYAGYGKPVEYYNENWNRVYLKEAS